MRTICLSIIISMVISFNLEANPTDTVKVEKNEKVKFEFSGFFRTDYWYDSRQIVDAVDGLFLLYPKFPDYDSNGKDINEAPSVNELAMATRLRTKITMPDIFKAKSSIMVEGDFTGLSTIVNVRLRHAYAKFVWPNSSLLVGLTWHPLFVTEVYPSVVNLNTGAPFQCFNRSPQLTYQYKLTDNLSVFASAVHQSDSRSNGPSDYSSTYLKTGVLPNLNLHLQYIKGAITVGGAFDYKSLRPRLYTTSIITPTLRYATDERINSYTGMVYMKYQSGSLTIKAKGMLGQNLAEHLLLGGYGVSKLDSLTGKETYTPTNHLFTFGNVTYGKTYQAGLFFGYAKNLGADDNFVSTNRIYGRGQDIDYLYRISPSLSYIKDKFQLSAELEYTAAYYGTIDVTDKGKVKNTEMIDVFRFLVVLQYNF